MITPAYFDLISIISAVLWLIIIIILAGLHKSSLTNNSLAPYFLPNIYFKIFAALGFSFIYFFVYEGGDTIAYWDGANNLNNLFFDSPFQFMSEMLHESNMNKILLNFNEKTGYPPGWIYREPESFFVSKILFFFSLITLKSYWAATIILAYISARISFSLFQTLNEINLHSRKTLAFALLFLPSASFWCSGVSKDTFVYLGLLLFINQLIQFYYLKKKITLWSGLLLFIGFFLMFQIRIYVLIAIIPALLVAYTRVIDIKNRENPLKRFTYKTVFYLLGGLTLISYTRFSSGGIEGIFQEVIVTQKDFEENPIYGDNKYSLKLNDYSISSIIKSVPQALIAALYRPFLWESRSISLILNGLEGTIFIYLTFLFFFRNLKEKLLIIRNSELLIFSVVFIFILGFSIGFTSGLFGVLVRMKAVILPFFILIISIQAPLESTPKAQLID